MSSDQQGTVTPGQRQAGPATRVLGGFTFKQLGVVLLWPLGVLAFWVLCIAPKNEDVRAAIEGVRERPPIVVFDVTDRLRFHGRAGLNANDSLKKMDEEVQTLVDSGYVVIDARTILGSPANYRVGDEQ